MAPPSQFIDRVPNAQMLKVLYICASFWLLAHESRDLSQANNYRKVASSNTSRLEAHAGFFRLPLKKIFDPYVL